MTLEFGLDDQTSKHIKSVLTHYPDITSVKIYGSRAMGNYKPHSDIDLAVFGNVDFTTLAQLSGELDELPLPYLFDVTVYNTIQNDALKKHVDELGAFFYQK